MGDGEFTFGDEGFFLGDFKSIADGAVADFFDEKVHGEKIAEAGGGAVVAGGVDAGPAGFKPLDEAVEFVVETAEEGMLAGLHEAEEVGEMDDARHVGFVELDATLDGVGGVGHGVDED